MIVISESDYAELKEQIKKELLEEQRGKVEPYTTICRREQSAIFDRLFPESMFPEDERDRRWKLRQAVSTLTNVCRERSRRIICGRVFHVTDRLAAVHSDMELDSAIRTFETICLAAREAYREDVTVEEATS